MRIGANWETFTESKSYHSGPNSHPHLVSAYSSLISAHVFLLAKWAECFCSFHADCPVRSWGDEENVLEYSG